MRHPLERIARLAAMVAASFLGGAAVGIVVLSIVIGLFVIVTLGWAAVLFTEPLTEIMYLGGVTGVIVAIGVRWARRFRVDEHRS